MTALSELRKLRTDFRTMNAINAARIARLEEFNPATETLTSVPYNQGGNHVTAHAHSLSTAGGFSQQEPSVLEPTS